MGIVVVRVLIEDSVGTRRFNGTAFFINSNTLITAKHVLANAIEKDYKIYLSEIPGGGKLFVPSTDIELCKRDVAVIYVKKEFDSIKGLGFTDKLKVGLDVKLIGYHNEDGAINFYNQNISGYTNSEHTYEIQDARTNGLSGSPVILDDEVCGITQAISSKKGVTYIIPISECCSKFVQDELSQAGKKNNSIYNVWKIIAKDKHEIEHGNSGAMSTALLFETDRRVGITFITDKDFKIFISYAYSNLDEEQWILEFLQYIGNILEKGFGKDNFFSINYLKNSNMKDKVLDADIFLVLLSKDYINNKQYMKELQIFKSDSSNTIILEYEKTEKPKEIENIKSFKFWSEEELHMAKTCTYQTRNMKKYSYFDLIEDIANKIKISMENKGKATKKLIKEKIFLATTTDDLDSFRNDIRRYFEGLNYDVYPKQYYPHDNGDDFKEAVKKDLKNCKIFIQLLSQFSKKGTDSLPEGYNKAQFDLAKELEVPILQWSEKIDLDCVEDDIQRGLLSTEFIKIIHLEEFKRMIERELEKIKIKKKVKNTLYTSLAFVNSCYREAKDREIAKDIHNRLSKQLMIVGPPSIKKPSEISKYIDEKLLLCDYYILVYGSVQVSWIEEQILVRYRKVSLRRNKEISSIIIYDSSYVEKEDINISAPYIKIINGRESDCIDEIKMHINLLEEGYSNENSA